jgi:hypothetical protein
VRVNSLGSRCYKALDFPNLLLIASDKKFNLIF